jgi:hypothetical protein
MRRRIYGEMERSPMLRLRGRVTPRKRVREEGWREAVAAALAGALLAAACAWVAS